MTNVENDLNKQIDEMVLNLFFLNESLRNLHNLAQIDKEMTSFSYEAKRLLPHIADMADTILINLKRISEEK